MNQIKTLGSIWLEEWKSENVENKEVIEKWEDKRELVLSHMCLVGKIEN